MYFHCVPFFTVVYFRPYVQYGLHVHSFACTQILLVMVPSAGLYLWLKGYRLSDLQVCACARVTDGVRECGFTGSTYCFWLLALDCRLHDLHVCGCVPVGERACMCAGYRSLHWSFWLDRLALDLQSRDTSLASSVFAPICVRPCVCHLVCVHLLISMLSCVYRCFCPASSLRTRWYASLFLPRRRDCLSQNP